MGTVLTGGCACGAIRYECTTDPVLVVNCHCRDCQRSSGGACSPVVVATDSFTLLSGEPKYYRATAESGNMVQRGFCADCGSPLFAGNFNTPHVIAVKLGSLDDPSGYPPMIDIWTQSAQPWASLNPNIPKIPTQPVM